MKKGAVIFYVIWLLAGISLVIAGMTMQIEYYSPMMGGGGSAMIFTSVWQLIRYRHYSKPENREAYQEKVRQEAIIKKDERKIQLRHRAGYITWIATTVLCFGGSFVAALLRADLWIVGILFGVSILEYIAAFVIYRILCRKM